jgi:hypothetical protein
MLHVLWKPKIHYRRETVTGRHPEPNESSPPSPHFVTSVLILPFSLHTDLPCGLFPSNFRTKILYAFLLCMQHAPRPPHRPWSHNPNNIGSVQTVKLFIMQFSAAFCLLAVHSTIFWMWEFHNHTELPVNLHFSQIVDAKTKYAELSCSKHSMNLIYS